MKAWLQSAFALVWSLSVTAGCSSAETSVSPHGFETGPTMLPGENCLRCHSSSGRYPEAPKLSAGGTVFGTREGATATGAEGARVELTDSTGKRVIMTTNRAGNFFTAEPLSGPLRVVVEASGGRAEMPFPAPAGSCNACHSSPAPSGGARGRIVAPSVVGPSEGGAR